MWEASLSLKGLGERRVDRATGKIKLDLREVKQVQAPGHGVDGGRWGGAWEPGRQVPGAPGPGAGRGGGP